MIKRLDHQQDSYGSTKVVYMKYAQASKLLDVLNGVSQGSQSDKTKKIRERVTSRMFQLRLMIKPMP